jgi:nucleoside-diphosphate-sugar epimerase
MTQSKKIAVLGANGRLSREVARAFHAKGWQVRAVTRNGKSEALANLAGMEFVAADAMNQDEVIQATLGCDVIFNGLNPVYTEWAGKCMPMAENVLAALRKHGATHLFPGNIYNFGSTLPETLTPHTPARPDHGKAHIRVQMENLFAEVSKRDDIQTINLRSGDFFGGDGTGSWFDLVVSNKITKGKVTYPGNPNILHAWAYLPDVAKAFVELAEKADTLSNFENFHFDGHNITGDQMYRALEVAMGKNLKRDALPGFVIKVLGWFNPQMREVSEVFYQWNTPHQVKDSRLSEVIGNVPHTNLEEAVRSALVGQGHMKDEPRDIKIGSIQMAAE